MTTEDDFQKALDAQPDDWQTRLVFADWLDERGDPRGPGYRALTLNRYVLCDRYSSGRLVYVPHQASRIFRDNGSSNNGREYTFPDDWFDQLPRDTHGWKDNCALFATRRAAEDAAALAFARLPAERRTELLTRQRSATA
jgi:uncharacterized protein (TIGR02996 family)